MEKSIEDTVTEFVLARVPPSTKIVIMALMGSRGNFNHTISAPLTVALKINVLFQPKTRIFEY